MRYSKHITYFLFIAILFSAFSLIYVRDVHRRWMSEYQQLMKTQALQHSEWSQLLLEESAWSAPARIQKIAQEQLGMVMPSPKSVIMVTEQ